MDLEGEDAEEEGGPERAVSARWQLIPSALRVSVAPVPGPSAVQIPEWLQQWEGGLVGGVK